MEEKIPLAFSIADACALSHVGRTTLYNAISRGELRARKVGRRTLIIRTDLVAWLESRPEAGTELPAGCLGAVGPKRWRR
jgi:excisionase family DNA binding protein